ncbi:MAG: CocE/NonD family hydrolase [Clostridia bacterium]|nr:CocE/NonD family hydrolase [Clostridia bacterium]
MRIEWDVPITMSDGNVLRADVFRPMADGRYPVLITLTPYGKGIAFYDENGPYIGAWRILSENYPEVLANNSNKYQIWEAPNPERWTRDYGYVCVRVDTRGTGRSPGYNNIYSEQETRDYYECIEWAGTQPWSNGNVGCSGISYCAINQWQVAALNPPHLKAICPVEGLTDFYREQAYHGGIMSDLGRLWFPRQVRFNQYGVGERGLKNPVTGVLASGSETMSEEDLEKNRFDYVNYTMENSLVDDYYKERTPAVSKITVPVLSMGNWGGNNLHLRGNIMGYLGAGSKEKWLEIHGREHFTEYYTDYGEKMQRDFFDHFLKGEDTWDRPPVMLRVRRPSEVFVDRTENEWPLARTQWTKMYLNNDKKTFAYEPDSSDYVTFESMGEGVTYMMPPAEEEFEMTGPLAARLFIASSTCDADIFVTFRLFDPEGNEVTIIGTNDPHAFIATGWLRASHRKLDPEKSTFYQPYHTHDEYQPLVPGQTYELNVEIWPTSMVIPTGYSYGFTISGCDHELEGDGPWPTGLGGELRGCGPFTHKYEPNRPKDIFGGKTTIFADKDRPSYILVPIIPAKNKK